MTIDEFEKALIPHPTYHSIFLGYKSKKLGAKTICNMMGVKVATARTMTPADMDKCIAIISGAAALAEVALAEDESPDPIKPGKKIEINEKDYESYGSW